MKDLPRWLQAILSIPNLIILLYVGNYIIENNIEFLFGMAIPFLIFGGLFFIISVPFIYFNLLPQLNTQRKQHRASQAITGRNEPVYLSLIFVTGFFIVVMGLQLILIDYVIESLGSGHWSHEIDGLIASKFLGWSVLERIATIGPWITLFGLVIAGGKLIIWLMRKYKRRPAMPTVKPFKTNTPPLPILRKQNDPFKDIRGYDD